MELVYKSIRNFFLTIIICSSSFAMKRTNSEEIGAPQKKQKIDHLIENAKSAENRDFGMEEAAQCYREAAKILKKDGQMSEAKKYFELALMRFRSIGFHKEVEECREEMADCCRPAKERMQTLFAAERYLEAASVALQNGFYADALEYFILGDPDQIEQIAEVLYENGDLVGALVFYENLSNINRIMDIFNIWFKGGEIIYCINIARHLVSLKNIDSYERALNCYKALGMLHDQVQCYKLLGRENDADALINQMLQDEKNSPQAAFAALGKEKHVEKAQVEAILKNLSPEDIRKLLVELKTLSPGETNRKIASLIKDRNIPVFKIPEIRKPVQVQVGLRPKGKLEAITTNSLQDFLNVGKSKDIPQELMTEYYNKRTNPLSQENGSLQATFELLSEVSPAVARRHINEYLGKSAAAGKDSRFSFAKKEHLGKLKEIDAELAQITDNISDRNYLLKIGDEALSDGVDSEGVELLLKIAICLTGMLQEPEYRLISYENAHLFCRELILQGARTKNLECIVEKIIPFDLRLIFVNSMKLAIDENCMKKCVGEILEKYSSSQHSFVAHAFGSEEINDLSLGESVKSPITCPLDIIIKLMKQTPGWSQNLRKSIDMYSLDDSTLGVRILLEQLHEMITMPINDTSSLWQLLTQNGFFPEGMLKEDLEAEGFFKTVLGVITSVQHEDRKLVTMFQSIRGLFGSDCCLIIDLMRQTPGCAQRLQELISKVSYKNNDAGIRSSFVLEALIDTVNNRNNACSFWQGLTQQDLIPREQLSAEEFLLLLNVTILDGLTQGYENVDEIILPILDTIKKRARR